jgi:hypothetical protein
MQWYTTQRLRWSGHVEGMPEERDVKKNIEMEADSLCGLVVRVPGYTTEMYCVSCEVRTECIYVM